MAGSTDYMEQKLLSVRYGGVAYTPPANIYLALFTAAPTDAGGGTEVSGGGYARAAVVNNLTNFPAANPILNGTVITFSPNPSAGWGVVTHFATFDALSGGNMMDWGALTTSKTINSGDVVSFPAGSLSFSQD